MWFRIVVFVLKIALQIAIKVGFFLFSFCCGLLTVFWLLFYQTFAGFSADCLLFSMEHLRRDTRHSRRCVSF